MRGLWTIGLVLWSATLVLEASAQVEGAPLDPDDPAWTGESLVIVDPDKPVPRNGSILLWVADADLPPELQEPPIVQVARTEGGSTRVFGGSVRNVIGAYWAWKAAEPLEPGDYLVSIATAVFGTASETVTVVDDAVLEPPVLTGEPVAFRMTVPSRQALCRVVGPEQSFDAPLFATHERAFVFAHPQLTFGGRREVANQFLYRAFTNDFDLTAFRFSEATRPAGPFGRPADEYCFSVEAMDIATSTIHSYPGLRLCAQHHDELGELGERELPVVDEQLSRFACSLPPEGFEERWCQVNDPCIEIWENENIIDVNACRSYFEACPDAKRPDAGTSSTGGAGGRIDFEPTDAGPESTPRSDAGDDMPVRGDEGCGCSIVRGSEPTARAALGFAALALLVFARLRRRAHCRGVASTQASSAR